MCGRYVIAPVDDEILEMIREINRSKLAEILREQGNPPITGAGEIVPASVVPCVALNKKGEQHVFPMKWGFSQQDPVTGRKKLLINARYETAAQKPTFMDSWAHRRCVIPASYYVEWEHDENKKPGKKYSVRPEKDGIVWLAGFYRMEGQIPVFVIVTRSADKSVSWMHDRMPLILPKDLAISWVRQDADPDMIADRCLRDMKWEFAG